MEYLRPIDDFLTDETAENFDRATIVFHKFYEIGVRVEKEERPENILSATLDSNFIIMPAYKDLKKKKEK